MTFISVKDTLIAMLRKLDPPTVALLLTLGLLGFASFYSVESMWGANHLAFLSRAFTYAFWVVAVVVLVMVLVPGRFTPEERKINSVADFIFTRGPLSRLLIAVIFTSLFVIFRMSTHFLGDGNLLMNAFAFDESFVPKWVVPGSSFLIRKTQWLLGGYSRQTAFTAFQLLSIVSGFVTIYTFISIAEKLSDHPQVRIISLISLLFSGGSLLFFGYVEHYPLLWAAVAVFINQSLGFLKDRTRLWTVLVAFGVAVLMHFEAVCLLGGVAYLVTRWFFGRVPAASSGKRLYTIATAVTAGGLAMFVLLYRAELQPANLFLPLVTGSAHAPDYAVFSLKHLADIGNLVLLIFPGCLVVLSLWLTRRGWVRNDNSTAYLCWLSSGSLAFLFLIDPLLGMARDWDLMSWTLPAPFLLLLRQLHDRPGGRLARLVIPYLLVCVLATTAYLAANVNVAASEQRFHSLLRLHGSQDDNGWPLFASYFLEKGDYVRAEELVQELLEQNIQPAYCFQILGSLRVKTGRLEEAEQYYLKSLALRPFDLEIRNELGGLYIQQGKYRDALATLKEASRYDPDFITTWAEGVGLAYYHLGHLDSAVAVADTLLMADNNSPGGHLLKMIVALTSGDNATARYHFQQYIKHGAHRSNYENIKEHYGNLFR
ncbi:MAG: tetratricopeptide repeat protein [bacterium]